MTHKTVLVTGCSSGFGRLTAKTFAARGWNVVATMRSPEKETELAGLDKVLVSRLDVTDLSSVSAAVAAALAKFGRIDALVNNAGVSGQGVFEQWDEDAIDAMFETNVFGAMRVTQAVLPAMREQGEGVIVNITSMAGRFGSPFSSVYSASKFAMEGLTEALAIEYAPLGIRVKAVAPGAYDTALYSSMSRRLLDNGDEQIKAYGRGLARQMDAVVAQMQQHGERRSDPQEVADKVYLCVTTDTPRHNVCGRDAEALLQLKQSMSEEQMTKYISDLLVPKH